MKYNKLVRDRIPYILKGEKLEPIIHIADDEEYEKKLKEKLQEEVKEYIKENNKDELSDILEVINAICDFKNIDKEELEIIRKDKKKKRGGFEKRIILNEVKE